MKTQIIKSSWHDSPGEALEEIVKRIELVGPKKGYRTTFSHAITSHHDRRLYLGTVIVVREKIIK